MSAAPDEAGPVGHAAQHGQPRPRPRNDLRALAELAGHHVDRTVLDTTHDLHRAIADRVFRTVPASAPVRLAHHAISRTVYASVRVGLRGLAALTTAAATMAARGGEVRWFEATPGRSSALSILHGIVGDSFADGHPDLDLPVRVRVAGRDTGTDGPSLAAAFPSARRRVAVFLHGLTEHDRSWDRPPPREDRPDDVVVLPDVVDELGWTPVRLRYGTGRAIGTNGLELAELLEDLLANWPVEVDELALVGHSMGGLVIRSACAIGEAGDHAWVDRVSHTVHLGTPHLGSWLERAANRGTVALRRFPETAGIARIIDTRARGIKDLRFGALDDTSWGEGVFDEDGTGDLDTIIPPPTSDVPLLEHATHHLIAGRLTRSPAHPVTRTIGDLLVTIPSATGRDGSRELTGGRIEILELPAGHFRLLRDPLIAEHLRDHLG